jgi:hypothetical protein
MFPTPTEDLIAGRQVTDVTCEVQSLAECIVNCKGMQFERFTDILVGGDALKQLLSWQLNRNSA